MKIVILAGGLGTRLSEETSVRPKPMVDVGGKPLLWHIMKIYSAQGFNDFIVCCGYKGHLIKEYFANYALRDADVTFDLAAGTTKFHNHEVEPWTVTLVETGERTETGGRIARIAPYLDGEEFALTYGDAVGDIDIKAQIAFHHSHGLLATITAVRPRPRFGALELDSFRVTHFEEKPISGEAWINGGFFVLSPKVLSYLESDETVWEHQPLERLTLEGQLAAYIHPGFWHPMDTLRDRNNLDELWRTGEAPWKIW